MGIHCDASNTVFPSIAALLHNLLPRHLTGANNQRAIFTSLRQGYYQITIKWKNTSCKSKGINHGSSHILVCYMLKIPQDFSEVRLLKLFSLERSSLLLWLGNTLISTQCQHLLAAEEISEIKWLKNLAGQHLNSTVRFRRSHHHIINI